MANQWSGEYIDIADDDTDDYYDPQDVKPTFITKAIGQYAQLYNLDDDSYPDEAGRRSQLYWTTDATKALIKLRGEREMEFEQGGSSKSLLWIDICKKMRALGYDFSAEKVSKKWHNIMITYNKNIQKKNTAGYVNWEFFEDIDIYYKHKRIQNIDSESYNFGNDCVIIPTKQLAKRKLSQDEACYNQSKRLNTKIIPANSTSISEISDAQNTTKIFNNFKLEMENFESEYDTADENDQSWWQDYFDKRLTLEKEKMRREQERHKDYMNFQKMALMLQEKIEKIKVDAINNLTNAITKMADSKMKK